MHLLKDENGNPIPHGSHDHGACHEHSHEGCSHASECGESCNTGEKCKNETVALLTYMQQHNEQHAAELDQMAENIEKMGLADAAKQIRESVADFQKGNMRLSLALTLVKEHLKEA
ncbi:MAG TPA: cobalt transporter [Candidatus Scatomonas merdavium]|nr:cobalt transporter [Candidatus Egerieimonas faecigallinarum]HIS81855.1 cobalt transporter [Candidatus Scatomonas merdavium]